MAGSTLGPDNFPFEHKRKRKPLNSHVRSLFDYASELDDTAERPSTGKKLRHRADADDTNDVIDTYEAGLGYGPDDAEEDDRGLH